MPRIELAENQKEKSQLEINRKIFADISLKVGQYLDFLYGSLYMLAGRHTEFAYPKKDWPQVEKLLTQVSEMLSDLANKKEAHFVPKNSLNHILGNYALQGQRMVEGRRYQKNISINVPLSPGLREGMKDLTEEDFTFFRGFKKEWDLILYYLDFAEKNPDILEKEMATEEGWIEKYKDFYIKGEFPVMTVPEKLQHINFFARLENYQSDLADVRGLQNLVDPIGEENFEKEFSLLPKNEFLGKESLKNNFLRASIYQQAA